MYSPRTQAYGETNYLKEKIQVLDRTKALCGPRTQTYGETNYLEEKIQVLDRTKALYCPRTQAYGETNYLAEKYSVWTQPGRYMALRIYLGEELPIDSRVNPKTEWDPQSTLGSSIPRELMRLS